MPIYALLVAKRILVIEDDESVGGAMRDALTEFGYDVDWCANGAAATSEVARTTPDLVLLDAGLPDIDGFSLCRWLRREHHDLAIVLVTARDTDIDVVVGLDAGANDYITKPFSMNVLLARVRAHLRVAEPRDPDAPIEIGSVTIDPAAYVVLRDGAPVEFRRREFELLLLLAQEVGRVVTRERLLADVWDLHWESPTKTLSMHVHSIRRKLGSAIDITSVRGVGYRLELL